MDRKQSNNDSTIFPDFESMLDFFRDKTAEYEDRENGNSLRLYRTEKGLEIARGDGYRALVTGIDGRGRLSVKNERLLYKGLDGTIAYKSVHGVLWGVTVADAVITDGRVEKLGIGNHGMAGNQEIVYLTVKRVASGCYIATCVYGSYDCPQVWLLRRFRDRVLKKSRCGRAFICIYYAVSPPLVRLFGDRVLFRVFFRKWLDRLIIRLEREGFEEDPYRGY